MRPERSQHPDVEALLREGTWVRALARRLVADEATADDVVQDTWLAALRRAPRNRADLRPWLACVVRNFAVAARRGDANRSAREANTARREPAGSAADTVERLEAQRELVDALAALNEPYRTTLLRRYFDGRSAAEIAREDGIPAATVRWRIAHGLDRMRRRFDERYGDRASWGLALLPLTRAPAPVAASAAAAGVTTLGVLAMSSASRATIAAIVLSAATLGVWLIEEARDAAEPPRVAADSGEARLAEPPLSPAIPALELAGAEDAPARAGRPVPGPDPAEPATDRIDESVRILGRFVDEAGNGIPRVRIVEPLREDGERLESDAQGNFDLSIGPMRAAVALPFEARADGWAAHFSDVQIAPGATVQRGAIVLVPGGTVSGKVIDETGAPVERARILTTSPVLTDEAAALRRTGPAPMEARARTERVAEARSDARGEFVLAGVPAGTLRVWAGHALRRWTFSEPIEVPAAGLVRDLVLRLEPLADDDRIDGVVLDPEGQPVPLAVLAYSFRAPDGSGSRSVRTDADGRFEIRLARKVPHDLHCRAPGNRWPAVAVAEVAPGTRGLEIRMRPGILLELHVNDETGDPIEEFEYTVSANGYGTTRRADRESRGQVRIEMPAMPFTVEVSAPGRARVELGPIDPASAPESLRCTLEPVSGLRGRVLAGVEPVTGAQITLHRLVGPLERVEIEGFPSRLHVSAIERDQTGPDGRFLITVQEAGTFALLCEATGYAIVEVSPLGVDPRVEREEVLVHLTGGGVIEGRVLTPPGRDAAGVVVGITRSDCRPQTQRVGADGQFRFERLTPGGWRVMLADREIVPGRSSSSYGTGSGPQPFEADCTVEDGGVTTFDLDLRSVLDATFVGQIAVNGRPAAGWTVMLTPGDVIQSGSAPASGIVTGSGAVRIALPRAAPYRLDLVPPSETGASLRISRQIEIRGGENQFAADVACGALEGIVIGDRSRHQLACRSVEGGEWSVEGILAWGDDGRFRVSHLPTGATRLRMVDTRGEDGYRLVADRQVDVRRAATTTVDLP